MSASRVGVIFILAPLGRKVNATAYSKATRLSLDLHLSNVRAMRTNTQQGRGVGRSKAEILTLPVLCLFLCGPCAGIKDEFTHLLISRQRKYQLRCQRDSLCTECGEPAIMGSRCLKHLVKARERQRKKRGLKKRYYGTLSYKLQANPEAFAKLP